MQRHIDALHGYCILCGNDAATLTVPITVVRHNPDADYLTVDVNISTDGRYLCKSCLFINLSRQLSVWKTEIRGKDRSVGQQIKHIEQCVGALT